MLPPFFDFQEQPVSAELSNDLATIEEGKGGCYTTIDFLEEGEKFIHLDSSWDPSEEEIISI